MSCFSSKTILLIPQAIFGDYEISIASSTADFANKPSLCPCLFDPLNVPSIRGTGSFAKVLSSEESEASTN
jgi:hypothetical protein